jgi:protein FLOWERING LOCUS T
MANESLVTSRVIGDVLDPFYISVDLTVLFNGMPIVSGMEFRAPTVSERPRVEIGGDDYRVVYTLVSEITNLLDYVVHDRWKSFGI